MVLKNKKYGKKKIYTYVLNMPFDLLVELHNIGSSGETLDILNYHQILLFNLELNLHPMYSVLSLILQI